MQELINLIKKNLLYIVIFVTGACVLIIEITAIRILSPYFGNTIYTFSSVITIILLALSIGYYSGGRLADKNPSKLIFYSLIFASSIGVFLLYISSYIILPAIGYYFSLSTGPLVTSFLLFLFPGLMLGMLSPFAIILKKNEDKKEGVGKISGNVFFYSTLGSIFGSLSAGFILIPKFGVDQIILGVAFVLLFVGILGMLTSGLKKHKAKLFVLILIVVTFSINIFITEKQSNAKNVVFVRDGVYEKITILDTYVNGQPARVFHMDKNNSGAMYLDSNELVHDYTKYYELYKIFKPDTRSTLVIGGASYSIPKALFESNNEINVEVLEIEPSNFELAKKYFKVPTDDRFTSYVADGRRYLHDTNKKYDLIFGDAYQSQYSIPAHLTTKEFFELSRAKLNKEGIFIGNFIGKLDREPPTLLFSQIRTFKQVYPNSYFFAVDSPEDDRVQNFIFVGFNSDRVVDFEAKAIKESQNELFLGLSEKLIDINDYDLFKFQILTDNYAPVEYLTKELFL